MSIIEDIKNKDLSDKDLVGRFHKVRGADRLDLDQVAQVLAESRPELALMLLGLRCTMEKYGVVVEKRETCPICGKPTEGSPPICPVHGTEGMEKRGEDGEDEDRSGR